MSASRSSRPAHAPPDRADVFRHDLQASLVVFLIAVPLSIGIAAASGAPVLAGLIAAVVGGLVAGPLGGSRLSVSGPAAGLTVVVAGLIGQFGWAVTCAITVCAGMLQVLLGLCRAGRTALAISPTVVHAMLAGIGITIAIGQAHVLFGGNAGADTWDNIRDLPAQIISAHGPATVIGVGVVALLLAWPRLPARIRAIPGPLVAIVLATVLSLGVAVNRVELPDSPLSAITLPELPDGRWFPFTAGIVTMTIVLSVQSLLSAVAVDKMAANHRSDLNRELVGQGGANIVSGLLGGLPVAGVIVRSAANVHAGGRTRASAVLHGVWVLLFTALLVDLVERIPMAALAGLLIVVGVKLVDLADVRRARQHGELTIYLVTITAVVLLGLLEGVIIGFALALLATLRRIVWARVRVERGDDGTCAVVVEGVLSFLSVPRLSRVLAQVPDGADVHLELVVDYLDHSAYEHLSAWQRQHESTGGTVVVDEIGRPPRSERSVRRWFSPWSDWEHTAVQIPRQEPRTHPNAFVLACSDSRMVPEQIPTGDRYTLRNIGNLVTGDLSMRAGVRYALEHLRVPTMIVCGHSDCGAMKALLTNHADGEIGAWLHWAAPRLKRLRDGHPVAAQAAAAGRSEVDQLALVNVAVQLESLRAMPDVAAALTAGRVQLIGLFHDVETGTLLLLDETGARFEPVPRPARTAIPGA